MSIRHFPADETDGDTVSEHRISDEALATGTNVALALAGLAALAIPASVWLWVATQFTYPVGWAIGTTIATVFILSLVTAARLDAERLHREHSRKQAKR